MDEPDLPQRRSVRLPHFDYGQDGVYFVTICTNERLPILGEVVEDQVQLIAIGEVVDEEWRRTPHVRPNVDLDTFVVMPNHVHGILLITRSGNESAIEASFRSPSQTLGAIIRGFKGTTTRRATQTNTDFSPPLWQRNFHEHVIRDDEDLDRIREYVATNALRRTLDRYYREAM